MSIKPTSPLTFFSTFAKKIVSMGLFQSTAAPNLLQQIQQQLQQIQQLQQQMQQLQVHTPIPEQQEQLVANNSNFASRPQTRGNYFDNL